MMELATNTRTAEITIGNTSDITGTIDHLLPKKQLLNPPVRRLGRVELVVRRTRERVRPGELLQLSAGTPNDADHPAVERHFENASRKRAFADKHHLRCAGGDTDGIRRADHRRETLARRRVAVDGARSG